MDKDGQANFKDGSASKKRIRVSSVLKRIFKRQSHWRGEHPNASLDECAANLSKVWFEEHGLRGPASDLITAKVHESDRGLVLVAASIVDAELENLLRLHFVSRSPEAESMVESLFVCENENIPMLQGTSIKIKLAFVLGLIDNDLRKACAQMQHMRSNVFAHNKAMRFLKHKDAVALFRCMKGTFTESTDAPVEGSNRSYITLDDKFPKESFFVAAMAVITGLEAAVKKAKRQRPRQLKSGSKA